MYGFNSILLIFFLTFQNSCSLSSRPTLKKSLQKERMIIKKLKPKLIPMLLFTNEELKTTKEDFKDYYNESIKVRIENMEKFISDAAIHWVDADSDSDIDEPGSKKELIFWTEGLAQSYWGGKEFLFIISFSKDEEPSLMLSHQLKNVSRDNESYRYRRFWLQPNKKKGFNNHVRAVLSYAQFGASGSTFYTLEIKYSRYTDKIVVDTVTTATPFSIEIP